MPESLRFSEQGDRPRFSSEHAGKKFKEIAVRLATLAVTLEGKKAIADTVWAVQEIAEEYARHYLLRSPLRSVRVMQPSGAIYVILADAREVLVPQPPPDD